MAHVRQDVHRSPMHALRRFVMDPTERIGSSAVIVSTSGGKDSTATALHLREIGIPFEAVFLDTGWEARETLDYLRGPLTEAIGPIRWLRAEVDLDPEREAYALELEGMLGHYSAMVRTCLKKSMMPARQVRWCTQATKVEPMHRWIDTLDHDVVSVVGIRADESEARKSMTEWEWSDKLDRWTWRPIIAWTLDDVIAIHARHGLAPNPLYLEGASRVGCWRPGGRVEPHRLRGQAGRALRQHPARCGVHAVGTVLDRPGAGMNPADPALVAALVDIATAIRSVGQVLAISIGALGLTIALAAAVRR